MNYEWKDYTPENTSFVEDWLDDEAVNETGLDDGWRDFYEYWLNDKNTLLNKNFWCKVVFENSVPFAAVALGFHDDRIIVMELVVNPEERGKGKGTALLKELLACGDAIISKKITNAEAVIYPSNIASKKAFENAGFKFDYAHEDGDALYYNYIQD